MDFRIQYVTEWGESLAVVLEGRKYPMAWQDGGIWTVSVPDCPAAASSPGFFDKRRCFFYNTNI